MKHRYELPLYSFYDHTGMVHRLEKMARRGWRLDKLGGMLWRYQPIEPRRLKYALVYFPEVTGFEPTPPESHLRLQELCAQAGWILAATAGKFQVYCNEDPDAVPLETDPGIQVDIIHRTMKRNFIPSYLLLSLAAVLQLFMQIADLNKDYSVWYSGKAYYFSGLAWMMIPAWSMILLFYLIELGQYFLWYRRAKARAAEGLYTPSPRSRWVQSLAILTLALLLLSWFLTEQMNGFVFAMLGALALAAVLSVVLSKLLKKVGASAKVNQGITIGVACILSLMAVMSVSNYTIQSRRQAEKMDAVLPLRLEDLGYQEENHTMRIDVRQSPLLKRTEYLQRPDYHQAGSAQSELHYLVVEVHFTPLWDVCLQDYLKAGARTVDAAPWGAQQVWQIENPYEAVYLLCWDERMVYMELEKAPDDTQKSIIGSKLKP